MKSYYLEDKIKETHDPLKAKIIKLVYAKAANEVSEQLNGKACHGIAYHGKDMIYSDILDIYNVPTKDLFIMIINVSLIAVKILDRELEETFKPYKKAGLTLKNRTEIKYAFEYTKDNTISDEELCTDFNKQIDDICNLIKESNK